MLTMADINQRLKQNFQNQLQDISELPEDLGRNYKRWVQGLIVQASQKMQHDAASQAQPGEEAAGQEAQE
jgi:hypothetical protein